MLPPPLLTMALAMAVANSLQVGDSFCINCLPEGRYQPIMKHFLKRFKPGQDRFEGIGSRVRAAAAALPLPF